MNIELLREDVGRWGWVRSIYSRVIGRLGKHLGIHIYSIWTRPLVTNPPDTKLPPGISLRILDREMLLAAFEDSELGLSCEFVESALARGDVAVGALDGTTLVAYDWSTVSAAPDHDGLWTKINRPYRYGYNTFTHPKYSGKHLSTAISFFSDTYFLERGYTERIGYVDISNLPSLAARKHRGEERIGFAGYVKWFGCYFMFRTPAVKRTGFELFLK